LKKKIHNTISYIFPYVCSLCQKQKPADERYLCVDCLAEVHFTEKDNCPLCGSDFDTLLNICPQCLEQQRPWVSGGAPLNFKGQSREIIHRFKYNSQLVLSRFLVAEMVKYLKSNNAPKFAAVTMVPLHWLRQWRRGYNQAEVLAQGISRQIGSPCHKLLKRKRSGPAQALKNKTQRQKNITHIFKIPEKQKLPDGAILLVDDVMTTGATLTACTKALNEAGAKEIYVLTAARG
jgi:competence protein ComFC